MEILRDQEFVYRRDMIISIFNEHVKELEEYVKYDIICYVNRAKIESEENPNDEKATMGTMFSHSLETSWVTCGSVRIRIAFNSILSDPILQIQKTWIQSFFKISTLFQKQETMVILRKEVIEKKKKISSELSSLVSNATKWKDEIGVPAYENRKKILLETEENFRTLINFYNSKLEYYLNEINMCKKSQQQSKIGMNEFTSKLYIK